MMVTTNEIWLRKNLDGSYRVSEPNLVNATDFTAYDSYDGGIVIVEEGGEITRFETCHDASGNTLYRRNDLISYRLNGSRSDPVAGYLIESGLFLPVLFPSLDHFSMSESRGDTVFTDSYNNKISFSRKVMYDGTIVFTRNDSSVYIALVVASEGWYESPTRGTYIPETYSSGGGSFLLLLLLLGFVGLVKMACPNGILAPPTAKVSFVHQTDAKAPIVMHVSETVEVQLESRDPKGFNSDPDRR